MLPSNHIAVPVVTALMTSVITHPTTILPTNFHDTPRSCASSTPHPIAAPTCDCESETGMPTPVSIIVTKVPPTWIHHPRAGVTVTSSTPTVFIKLAPRANIPMAIPSIAGNTDHVVLKSLSFSSWLLKASYKITNAAVAFAPATAPCTKLDMLPATTCKPVNRYYARGLNGLMNKPPKLMGCIGWSIAQSSSPKISFIFV